MAKISDSQVRIIYSKILSACTEAPIDKDDVSDYLNICESEGIRWAGKKGDVLLKDMLELFGKS